MVKILHCADVHLDSPFAKESPQASSRRKNELRSSFVNMMMYARDNAVDIILLPGDIFDTPNPSEETVEIIKREFTTAKSHNIKIVIAPGNHDPFCENSVWNVHFRDFGENVFVFDSQSLSKFDFDDLGLCVYGYAFKSAKMTAFPFRANEITDVDKSKINILCAHADLTRGISDYAPLNPSDIGAMPFDYIALGHIHERTEPKKEGSVYYSYCGCLEGRDFGECGEKGATVAILEKDKESHDFMMKSAFVRLSHKRFECMTLDVSGMESREEIENKFEEMLRSSPFASDTLLRLILTGQLKASIPISNAIFESKAKCVYAFELADQTIAALDYDSLENDRTIRGALYDSLKDSLFSEDEKTRLEAQRALRIALCALSDGDIASL